MRIALGIIGAEPDFFECFERALALCRGGRDQERAARLPPRARGWSCADRARNRDPGTPSGSSADSRTSRACGSRPWNRISPSLSRTSPAIVRPSVVLPEPEPPTRATTSPTWISTLTPCSARFGVALLEQRLCGRDNRRRYSAPRPSAPSPCRLPATRRGTAGKTAACAYRDAAVPRGFPRSSLFDDHALFHHDDAVGVAGHHRQVVADQQNGRAFRLGQLHHQFHDVALDHRVERGRRLVGDQQAPASTA